MGYGDNPVIALSICHDLVLASAYSTAETLPGGHGLFESAWIRYDWSVRDYIVYSKCINNYIFVTLMSY